MDHPWHKVAALDDVEEGGTLAVEAAGESICLYRIGGRIEGDCIECPLHQAVFHIPTGSVRQPPATDDLRVFPVKVEGRDISVQVPATSKKSPT